MFKSNKPNSTDLEKLANEVERYGRLFDTLWENNQDLTDESEKIGSRLLEFQEQLIHMQSKIEACEELKNSEIRKQLLTYRSRFDSLWDENNALWDKALKLSTKVSALSKEVRQLNIDIWNRLRYEG